MDDFRLRQTHNDYTIGWVCALPNEQTAAIFMLDERHEDLPNPSGDHNTYMLGSIGKHNVVIAGLPLGRVGNNTAATVATRMVSTFPNIRVGLMVGVGGGIPQKTRLGDVVISCPNGTEPGVIQWDMGKTEAGQFIRTGSLAPPPTALLTALTRFKADHITTRRNMLAYLHNLATIPDMPKSFLKSDSLQDLLFHPSYGHTEGDESCLSDEEEDDCRRCDKSKVIRRSQRESGMIHCGLIASGNQVIKDANLRDSLYEKFNNNILCIEMEAAGLMNDFPCVVIRGISDYSDSHKNKKWQDYAAATAAACAKALLMVVATSEVDQLQRVQLTISPSLIQSAMHYWPFRRSEKKDNTGSVVIASEEVNLQDDPRRPHMPPLEMAQLDDTSHSVKSGETTPEEKPRELVAIEAPKQANSDDTSLTHQTLETWLQRAPPDVAAMFQQGNFEAAMKNIYMRLGQLPVPQEDENPHQGYAAGRDNNFEGDNRNLRAVAGSNAEMPPLGRINSMPTQASTPFPEDSKGNTSERNYKYGNMKRPLHSGSFPCVKTPSAFPPEYRVHGREQSQTNNDDNAPSIRQNPSGSTKYRMRTPSPVQNEAVSLVSERNHGQFSTAPAPSSLRISTKPPNNEFDAVDNGARYTYPWSPPQSPRSLANTSQSSSMRRVSEPQSDDGESPLQHGPSTENSDFLGVNGENRHLYAEPDQINPNEIQGSATLSQSLQFSSPVVENASVYASRAGNNDIGPRDIHSRYTGASVTNSSKLQRSATPIPSQRPPNLARNKSISRQAVRNSNRGPGNSQPYIPDRPNQGRRSSLMTMDNNSVGALGTGISQPQFPIQSIPPNTIRKVQSQIFISKLPRPVQRHNLPSQNRARPSYNNTLWP